MAIGLDGRKHRRNLNILVCGGSGAGKTRFFAKPNVMNANTSFVCLDPKGELLRDTGNLLKAKGYDIKVIDLINMEKSHCYNPFVYLRDDILKHPNVALTTDGGAAPYVHGEDTRSIAAISIDTQLPENAVEIDEETHNYVILTGEELEEKLNELEENQDEEQ